MYIFIIICCLYPQRLQCDDDDYNGKNKNPPLLQKVPNRVYFFYVYYYYYKLFITITTIITITISVIIISPSQVISLFAPIPALYIYYQNEVVKPFVFRPPRQHTTDFYRSGQCVFFFVSLSLFLFLST